MVSRVQLEANRANAKRSTGPKTEQGKARSKLSALKHGLTGNQIIVGDEDPEEFEALRESLETDLQAEGAIERELVGRIAALMWRQRRIFRMEAALVRRDIEWVEQEEREQLYDGVFPMDPGTPEDQERADERARVLNEPVRNKDDWELARLKEITRPDSPELLGQKLIDRAFDRVVSDSRWDLVNRYDTTTANNLKNAIAMLLSVQAIRLERGQGRVIDSISLESRLKPD